MKEQHAIQQREERKVPQSGRRARRAFTLIELMVVIGIIAVLLAILLPAMNGIRRNAKNTSVAAFLSSIGKSIDAFAADFGDYPDSQFRDDPINWNDLVNYPDRNLSGTHWLARALVGHDLNGVDAQGLSLKNHQDQLSNFNALARRSPYLPGDFYARDNDKTVFPGPNKDDTPSTEFNFKPTGRILIYDKEYGSPVLYYRANARAMEPACVTGEGAAAPSEGVQQDRLGIYRQSDNGRIAGDTRAGANNFTKGWDFSGRGGEHRLARFGSIAQEELHEEGNEETFTHFIHNHAALTKTDSAGHAIGHIAPHNPATYILITAGADSIFGSSDDITNFPLND